MKIELTIKSTYVPTWSAWEGLREILQNARDSEVEFDAPMCVTHKGEILTISNEGASLQHRDLLLGQTTKYGVATLAGQFGEGLKLGVLALVRAGHKVVIRTNGETWIPSLQMSEAFGEEVLTFQIRKTKSSTIKKVQIEVGGIDAKTWEEVKTKFLFLQDAGDEKDRIQTGSGTLLLASKYTGMLFVKGIFVCNDLELIYGYDFENIEVDRDRKMIAGWNRNWETARIWKEAAAKRPDLLQKFSYLLMNAKLDVVGVDDYVVASMSEQLTDAVTQEFVTTFGADAIPVATLAESADAEHFGKKGVMVGKSLQAVLASTVGTFDKVQEQLKETPTHVYSWYELSEEEKISLMSGLALVQAVDPTVVLDAIRIVDFPVADLLGTAKGAQISLAKKILVDPACTLETLVHEVAHREGFSDGSKNHVDRIEKIWSAIVVHLRKAVGA